MSISARELFVQAFMLRQKLPEAMAEIEADALLGLIKTAGLELSEGWKTNESAPKDGRFVLVAKVHSLGYSWGVAQYERQGTIEGWVSKGYGIFGELGLGHPDYWMAVPPLPTKDTTNPHGGR